MCDVRYAAAYLTYTENFLDKTTAYSRCINHRRAWFIVVVFWYLCTSRAAGGSGIVFNGIRPSVRVCACAKTSDVTKLVKIHIRRMQIFTFKIRRLRIEPFILSVGKLCTVS